MTSLFFACNMKLLSENSMSTYDLLMNFVIVDKCFCNLEKILIHLASQEPLSYFSLLISKSNDFILVSISLALYYYSFLLFSSSAFSYEISWSLLSSIY